MTVMRITGGVRNSMLHVQLFVNAAGRDYDINSAIVNAGPAPRIEDVVLVAFL